MSKRLQIVATDETADELQMMAEKYGVTVSQLGAMCLRAGMDVIKLATNQDYQKIMEMMGSEYDLVKEMEIEKKAPGKPAGGKSSGQAPG